MEWCGISGANRKLVEDYLLLEGPIMEAQMVRSDGRLYGEVVETEDDSMARLLKPRMIKF